MANSILIKLVSTAKTGTTIVRKKNPKNGKGPIELMKYDKKIRKRVLFKEKKIK